VTDVFSRRKRSAIMSAVRSSQTGPERAVGAALRELGVQFRTNANDLEGCPDIVLDEPRVAVFVHGCFWHGHAGCARASLPKSRRSFWTAKVTANRMRDRAVTRRLRRQGYRVATLWSCQLKNRTWLRRRLLAAARYLS
jgi:DNA mismatch endonuclease (patch repair protein)